VEPLSLADEARGIVRSLDPDVPVHDVRTFASVLGQSSTTFAFLALVLGLYGALAVALGAVGVFGVTSFTVGRRLPEFGVRMALGSSRWSVVGSAVRGSLLPVLVGLVGGLAAALGLSRLLESSLYEVPPTDPWTYAGVAGLLVAVGLVAALLPSWRAGRVDPVSVLNSE
jgi:ABC-type antimicrobial peptide transport system permease subunit